MTSPLAIGPVQLSVDDVTAMSSFYEEVVGLAVIEETSDRVSLGVDDTVLLFLKESSAEQRPSAAAGLYHMALRVPDREALGSALLRVEAHDMLEGAADHGVSEAIYLKDPEGNGIEIYCDRPRSDWSYDVDGDVQMVSDPLDKESLREEADEALIPVGADIGHVHLEMTELEPAVRFFVDCLGFDEQARYGSSARFLGADDYHHHVGLNTWKFRTVAQSGRGLDWFTVWTDTRERLAQIRARCEEDGFGVDERDGAVFVAGPDAMMIRLAVYPEEE